MYFDQQSKSFWENKKVLITGHTGFKGSWLSVILLRLGAEVSGFSLPMIPFIPHDIPRDRLGVKPIANRGIIVPPFDNIVSQVSSFYTQRKLNIRSMEILIF